MSFTSGIGYIAFRRGLSGSYSTQITDPTPGGRLLAPDLPFITAPVNKLNSYLTITAAGAPHSRDDRGGLRALLAEQAPLFRPRVGLTGHYPGEHRRSNQKDHSNHRQRDALSREPHRAQAGVPQPVRRFPVVRTPM